LCVVMALGVLPSRPAAASSTPDASATSAAVVPATAPALAAAPPGRTILVSSEPPFGGYARYGARSPLVRGDGREVLWWSEIPPYVYSGIIALDLTTGAQTYVSISPSGDLLDTDTTFSASRDGRFVVFRARVPFDGPTS